MNMIWPKFSKIPKIYISLPDLRWVAISLVLHIFFLCWVFRILQMELEAENLWVHSASHDFDDKKNSSKNINFFLSKKISKTKFVIFKKYFFKIEKSRKFSLKININFSKKVEKISIFSRFFQLFSTFFENCYIDFQWNFLKFFGFRKNIFSVRKYFSDFFFLIRKN